jgi:predicted SAM-dependent methyltransferase
MKRMLNLGCGGHYLPNWTNVDFYSNNKDIIQHDLRKGIPFSDETYDFVYHSHVLEHFTLDQARFFIKECYRVLKPGGILRVAVPNLEDIAISYLSILNEIRTSSSDPVALQNYHWIKLELLDQLTRNFRGGEMKKYLEQKDLVNKDYILSRIGEEGKQFFNNDYQPQSNSKPIIFNRFFALLLHPRQLLKKLILLDSGFRIAERKTALESLFIDWPKNNLDTIDGKSRKPDSIYFEAMK